MKRSNFALTAVAFTVLSAGVAGSAFGQNQPQPQPQPGGNNNRGGRGNFDPAQMRAQYMERLKTQLGASEDEWKVLQPKVEKVMDAARAARNDSGRFGGGRGGRPGGDTNATPTPPATPATPVAQAAQELKTVAENKASTPEECAQKLAAFRAARDKAKGEVTAAQKELKELLTPKQEAILVSSGTLD
jgi:hypothetical protein